MELSSLDGLYHKNWDYIFFNVPDSDAENACKKDHSVITFPEGTVSVDGGNHRFQFAILPGGRDFGTFGNSRHVKTVRKRFTDHPG